MERLSNIEGILLESSIASGLIVRSKIPCISGYMLATTFSDSLAQQLKTKLLLWNALDLDPKAEKAKAV